MKKILYSSFAVLFAASILASCNKEINNVESQDDDLVEVTIIAGNPSPEAKTKTEIYSGSPYWSPGDVIGVTTGTDKNYKFPTTIASRATTATFTGTTAVSGDQYAYYPYQELGIHANGMRVEIPVNQYPTSTSFDGAADIMFSKKFNVDPSSKTVNGLEFARAGAIIKVVLVDGTSTSKLSTQHPNMVSLTTTGNLVGRVYLDVVNQSIGELYGNQSQTVNAILSPSTSFAINGTNGTYLIVYPQTLAEGSNLTLTANTELYAISKSITIPAGGIDLEPGKITTLNISIADAHVSNDPAPALPFSDNFAWSTASPSDVQITPSSTPALATAKYSTSGNVYTTTSGGEVRIGSSKNTGYLTTVGLNLSEASHITVSAKRYGSGDGGKIVVSVDGGDPIEAVNDASALAEDYTNYIFNLPAATAKSKVTIATSSKRGYVNNVSIETGTYVPPATPKELPYNNTLISGHTDFTFDEVNKGSLSYVWNDNSNGVQANGYGTTSNIEAYLESPSIDLTGVTNAIVSFDHSIRYFADVATAQSQTGLQVKVGDGEWSNLTITTYPATQGDGFINAIISLDAVCGNTIKLRFKYLATSTNPGRWRIKNFTVKEATHSVTAAPNPAIVGAVAGNSVDVTATSDYAVTFSTTGSGFTVTQNGKVFTVTASGNGGASESTLGTLVIKEAGDASVNTTVTVKQSAAPTGTTITKTMNEIVEANSYTVSAGSEVTCYKSFALDENITISTTGEDNCGSFWGTTTNDWRLYQNKSGNVTITASGTHTLSSVTIKYSISNTGTLKDDEDNVVASNSAQSVTGSSVTFTVGNTASATNGQVRITQISVTYN